MKKIMLSAVLAGSLISSVAAASISFKDAANDYTRKNPDQSTILSYSNVVLSAKKSVVNISTTRTIKSNFSTTNPFNDPFFEEFFGFRFKNPHGEQQKQKSSALGSGVIISNDGYIVTNNHVVEGSDEIVVSMLDSQKEYKAKIVGLDSKTDLAIIKIEANGLEAISFGDSSKLLEGDVVFAIGNPFGVGGSVSSGIISGLNKDNIGLNQYEDFIQTDASINPGNSGGALVDSRGALVGINSAILSRSGGNNGIGFAIPSNMVKEIASKLIKDGKITRGYIGVSIGNLTADIKEAYTSQKGALIIGVGEDSPAAKAGLKRGDLITKVGDKEIENANALKNLIGSFEPNSEVTVEYERGGKINKIKIRLANMDAPNEQSTNSTSINGLEISNLNNEIIRKYKLSANTKGVLVTNVKENSSASKLGFAKGDLIVQINERSVENIDAVKDEIAKSKKQNRKVIVWLVRGGMTMAIVLK